MVLLASWLSRSSVESWERLVFCRAAPTPWAPGLLRGSFGAVSSPSGRLERQFPG